MPRTEGDRLIKAIIVSYINYSDDSSEYFDQLLSPGSSETVLVAADSGADYLLKKKIIPDIVIGDMDSISTNTLEFCKKNSITLLFNKEKDETDTELAVRWCSSNKIKEALIINSLSKRFDHSMGVVSNLILAEILGVNCRVESTGETLYAVLGRFEKENVNPGTVISLIPVTGKVEKVTTEGLKYSLNEEDLYSHSTRSISNIALEDKISVSLKKGILLVSLNRKRESDG